MVLDLNPFFPRKPSGPNTVVSMEQETDTKTAAEVLLQADPLNRPRVVSRRVARRGQKRLFQLNTLGWVGLDIVVSAIGIFVGYMASPYVSLTSVGEQKHVAALPCAISFCLISVAVAHIFGLHDRRNRGDVIDVIVRVFTVICLSMAALSLGWTWLLFQRIGRYVLIVGTLVSLTGMAGFRILFWKLTSSFAQTVCFLGDDKFCFRVAQFVEDHPIPFNVRTIDEFNQHKYADDLSAWAIDSGIDEFVFDTAGDDIIDENQLIRCMDAGVSITPYADFVEDNYCFVPVDQIDARWLFGARLDVAHPYYHGLKRAVDVVVALLGLVISAPAILLAALAIKLESRGPVLYSQIRVGRFNRQFRIYKLRTMVTDAESNGAQWASQNDSRITPVGNILRKTRLDELPQFWNILKGEMSLVGPRPERPEFVELLSEKIPFFVQRHLVKPGLTGWAQINYPYGASVEDAQNKLTYDLYYIKRASLGLDLQILLRTVGAMMKGSR